MTADLVAWLTAVWDEQEQDAQRAIDLTVDGYPADKFNVWWRWARAYELRESGAGGFTTASGAPSPTEVLARIAADRQILALHKPYQRIIGLGCEVCLGSANEGRDAAFPGFPCPTLRLLAQPYADRPGFEEAWRVTP